ncbi:hypothetical protein ACIA5C_44780 [Actinoplanes sp. NPDC051343]|jgi:hypothetical protein|uniref:hypothetical protein n=1 Tax=Actinoplanes sp. NPDC051343 TaxID=3363906 RepID=UPI003795B4CF
MSARLSFGRTLAVAGIVTAVAVPLTAGSAFADPKPHHPPAPTHTVGHLPVPGHSVGHHPMPAPHHDVVTTLRTRVRNAQVRQSPIANRHGRTLSVLRTPGSRVAVTCWTLGARENGSNTWYRTVAPARGYISSTEVARPAHPVGRCK